MNNWLIASRGLVDAGIWFTPIDRTPSSLVTLHAAAFDSAWPLTWFFLNHFVPPFAGRGPQHSPLQRRQGYPDHQPLSSDTEWVRRIAEGDPASVENLLVRLGDDRGGSRPEQFRVLPRSTITITVSVGRALPPDLARVRLE